MSFFSDLLAAAETGAASIYHAVLSTGSAIHLWQADPAVNALVSLGVETANGMLKRAGVTGTAMQVIDTDVHAALKALAIADPTVPSLGSLSALTHLAGSLALAVAPQSATVVSAADIVAAGLEALAHPATPAQAPGPAP